MKTLHTKPIAMALGLVFGTAVTVVGAADIGIDLDEAIDDYSDVPTGPFLEGPSTYREEGAGYRVDILLDEAYHDYSGSGVRADKDHLENMEQTDLAVLEFDK